MFLHIGPDLLPLAVEQLKDRSKIERMLGKIQARHPSVNDLYKVAVQENSGGLRLNWKLMEERRAWRAAREGAYLLRTNLKEERTEELWTLPDGIQPQPHFRDRSSNG